MRNFLNAFILFFVIFSNATTHSNAGDVVLYKSALGFKVAVPLWDTSEMMHDDIYEFICAKSEYIFIKIYKLQTIENDILHTITWRIWDTDPNAHFIINTKTDEGGIIITTYRNNNTALHRLRIITHNNAAFIIECSAPEKTFYNYEVYFKTVFQSFQIL